MNKIPEGWKLVPLEPTPEMLDALAEYIASNRSLYESGLYKAMLAAAPQPPAD